jgi:N-methylhydantoinase B
MTFSACAYALKCLIDPDLPVNDGFYRVVSVHAPAGTVTNCTWPAPVEETELNYPVRIDGLALVENSEGPGRFRGGLGLRKDYRFDLHTTFTILADRDRSGPWGVFDGHAGRIAEYVHIREGVETRLASKTTLDLVPGDVISVRTCGGGGYGAPEERDPERVLRDVLQGKVSAERARDIYKVAIADRRIDVQTTEELRA